jgi:hypothetical protein
MRGEERQRGEERRGDKYSVRFIMIQHEHSPLILLLFCWVRDDYDVCSDVGAVDV